MDIFSVYRALSPALADSLEIKLESCVVASSLTRDEATVIIDDLVAQLRAEDPKGKYAKVLDQLTGALVNKIFG